MGLALDLTNTERLELISGEERFPPSPIVWGLTSHGSLLAWTAIHKKAPAANGAYAFMRQPQPLPLPPAASTAVPPAAPAALPAAAPAPAAPVAAAPAPAVPPAAPVNAAKATEDLQNAAEMGDHEALLKALAEGADVNAADSKTLTPLHWAAKCGRPDDIKALLKVRGLLCRALGHPHVLSRSLPFPCHARRGVPSPDPTPSR